MTTISCVGQLLAESGALELNALRYILLDVLPDEKESHFFSRPPKGMARRPDTTELLGMLHTRDYTVNSKQLFPVFSIRNIGHKEPVIVSNYNGYCMASALLVMLTWGALACVLRCSTLRARVSRISTSPTT